MSEPRPASVPDALEIEALVGGYQDSIVIRDVSVKVPSGSVVALIGPNGAGKTTLLRLASGLLRPRTGRILMDGVDISKLSPHERCEMGLCHIPEGRAMFPSLTVRENIVMQARKGTEPASIEAAVHAFPILGTRLNSRASTLSGGQQQMLALVPAFVAAPRVVMVDEPSLGLAPVLVDGIFAFLAQLSTSGVAMLVVEQYVKRALALATSVYVLDRGSVKFGGSTSELQSSSIFSRYLGST